MPGFQACGQGGAGHAARCYNARLRNADLQAVIKATISTSGTQLRVKGGEELTVDRLAAEPGSSVVYDKVLLVEDDGKVALGTPLLANATVTAEVLGHFRGDKVRVFKMRRRKKYRRLRGHRSELSRIRITSIDYDKSALLGDGA